MPVIFAAHGAPILLDDAGWMGELASWASAMPRPRSVLMISAHWEQRPTALGATRTVPLVYDFYGFPERYYQTKYPAPGAPALAARVRELLGQKNIDVTDEPERGLDHGAFVPLLAMYPEADVPVLQMSMPGLDPHRLLALGQALAPLRDDGVLIFGSGFLTHNMRYVFRSGTPAWAREFDGWVEGALSRFDVDALVDLPFALPTAVAGIALTTVYAEHGVIGEQLAKIGIKVAFTPLGVTLALTFIGIPFVVRTVQPVLEEIDADVEEAAAVLGATRLQTFRRVIFPGLLPAVLTGFALAFARSLGEYGSVVFISGNMPMRTEITPLLIVTKLEQYDTTGATAIAVVMLVAAFLMLLAINGLQAWTRARQGR